MLKIYCDGCNQYINDLPSTTDCNTVAHNVYCPTCKPKVEAFREWCHKAEIQARNQLAAAIEAKRIQVFGS